MRKAYLPFLALLVAMMLAMPSTSFAESPSPSNSSSSDSAYLAIGKDIATAGSTIDASNLAVQGNLFAAGETVIMDGGTVGCDIFAAGNNVKATGLTAASNLFLAGNNVDVSNSTGSIALLVGETVILNGTFDGAQISGNSVTIKGTINGDVNVDAKSVTIAPDTVITGTLAVSASSEPTIASSAKIGSYQYTQNSHESATDAVVASSAIIGSALWMMGLGSCFVGMLLLGALLLLLMTEKPFAASSIMLRKRPLQMLLTGFIAILLIPLAVILFFCTMAGWTIAVALILAAIVITIFSGTFTALALGRLFFAKLNKWLSSLIMVAIFALALSIPILGMIVDLFCIIFLLGYLLVSYWDWRRAPSPDEAVVIPTGPSAIGTAESNTASPTPPPAPKEQAPTPPTKS